MDLLERQDALVRMAALLDGVEGGAGAMMLVGGEAGIGKTVLVRQFCREHPRDVRVLTGACDPLSTPRPLGPVYDFAEQTGGELANALTTRQERTTLFGAVLDVLAPAGKPVVAVIEDAHWADEATLDLLRFLGRRIGRTLALLLVTYRDDEVGPNHPLRVVFGDLATTANVERLLLSSLSPGAVSLLASGAEIDAGELYRQTGGNPFYVTEVLAAGGGVPASVRDAVLSRAARLSPRARVTLDAAAVIGPPIDPDPLVAVSGTSLVEIDECLNAGVLKSDERALLFRHELGRDAVLGAISPPRQTDPHRRVLDVLVALPDDRRDLTRISHHAEEAGDRDAVLRFAPRAAERAASLGAHREAAAHYDRALRFAGRLTDDERAPLLEGWYLECSIGGRFREAADALGSLLEIARRNGDHAREAYWLSRLSSVHIMDGRNADGEQALRDATEILDGLPESPVHAFHLRMRSHVRMLNRDTAEAIETGIHAVELARRFDDTESLIVSFNCVGCAHVLSGNEVEGREYLHQALETAIAHSNLGTTHGEIYRLELAEHHLREAFAVCERHDLGPQYVQAWLALVHCYRGRWSEATDLALTVLRHPVVPGIARMMALLAIGRLRVRRGDPDAWTALDEALALAGPTDTLQRLGPVHAARAEAAWLAGDIERTAAEARGSFDLAVAHEHAWFTGELAYWLWKAGALKSVPTGMAEPFAFQIAGDPTGATRLWDERLCPYEAARARSESDDPAELTAALAEVERIGARPLAQLTARRLRELGLHPAHRGPRRTTREHPAMLTEREAECLRLIADGCRNAEIAERLFVSPKTVERHVGSLFAKLDVHSRTEALATAKRLGLFDQTEGAAPPN